MFCCGEVAHLSFLLFPSLSTVIFGGGRYLSLCADVQIDAYSILYFLSPLCGLLILQDCTVYETENKILHVVSFCF